MKYFQVSCFKRKVVLLQKFDNIQGVPLITAFFQKHTAPTKVIRFQKLLHL